MMLLPAVAVALILQGAPIAGQTPVPRASVAGVVVQSASGEPISGVTVTLARTDAALGAFATMVAGDHPPTEVTFPAEILTALSEQIAIEMQGGNLPPQANAEAAALSSLPIADIHSIIVSVNGKVAVIPKSAPPTTTDSQGRFAFSNVEPGTYKLIFAANGYARQDYGQRSVAGEGIPIVLAPGQVKSDLVMRMSPVGAIAGRALDKAGLPIAGVPVQLFRFVYDETGQRKTQRMASSQTDDHGEYRFYYLSPGRYYMSAGNPSSEARAPNLPAELAMFGVVGYVSTNKIPQNYAISYFPGVADANAATAIEVPPGADIGGIDLSLSLQPGYRVRGRVIDPRTGQPPPTASISMNAVVSDPRDNQFGIGIRDEYGAGPSYNSADGTFEIRNVSPGSYTITVNLPNTNPLRQADMSTMTPAERSAFIETMNAAEAASPRAFASIRVTNSDVEGVAVTIGTAGSIAGRIRSESEATSSSAETGFLRVQLKPLDGIQVPDGGLQSQPPKADGTIRINGVRQGDYRLTITGLPPGYYLKEARLGETDLLNTPLRFSAAETGTLDLLISPRVGQIEGFATDSRGQPAPGAQVVLIPDRNRERTELFRPVIADASGHFTIPAVTPGDYRLVSWDGIESFAFFDPALIRQAEESGKIVHVAESSKQTINVSTVLPVN